MFTKMYDEGDQAGGLPAEVVPNTVIDQPPESGGKKDEGELYPEDFDASGEKVGKPESDDTPAPGGEEQEPSLLDKVKPEYYENDAELLAELDIEGDNIRDVLVDMKQRLADGETSYNKISPQAKRLESFAEKVGLSPDDVLKSLEELDPRNAAAEGPQWGGLDDFFAKNNVEAEHQPFYRNLATAMLNGIAPQIEARFGRLLNSYDGRFNRVDFDRQVDRFLAKKDKDGNEVNSDWNGRQEEIWQTLKDNPTKLGKPNAVDWATRFIKAGETPKTVKKLASKEAREKLQEIEANRRKRSLESPGRGADIKSGKGSDDPTSLDYGMEKRDKLIDELERKGGMIGTKR
jgi:hypothetical protein